MRKQYFDPSTNTYTESDAPLASPWVYFQDALPLPITRQPDWKGFGGALTLNPVTRPWLEQVANQSNFAYTQLAAIWATGDVNPPYSCNLWNTCVAAVPVDGFAGLTHAIRSLAIQFEIPFAFDEDGVAVVIDSDPDKVPF